MDAARGLACGEEAGDGVVHAVEDPGVCVDEESAHRDVHAQTLDAVVEGRRVDRLQEGRASETRVLALGDHAVVAVHREAEPLDRDADVVGERGEGPGLPHEAGGELRSEVGALLGLGVGDRPHEAPGLFLHGGGDDVEGGLLVDESVALGIDPHFGPGIVEHAAAGIGNALDGVHVDELRACGFAHEDAVSAGEVGRESECVRRGAVGGVESGCEAASELVAAAEAARGEHDGSGVAEYFVARSGSGGDAADAAVLKQKATGACFEERLRTEGAGALGERLDHVPAASLRACGEIASCAHAGAHRPEEPGLPGHAHAAEPLNGGACVFGEGACELGSSAGFDDVACEVFDGRLAASGDRDGAGRNDGVSAHEGATLENGDAPRARLERGDRGGKACAARADDEDVVGILRSAACGVGCGLRLGFDGGRGEERRGGE